MNLVFIRRFKDEVPEYYETFAEKKFRRYKRFMTRVQATITHNVQYY
jgi:hypothetical protein